MISLLGVSICVVIYSLLWLFAGVSTTLAVLVLHCVVIPLLFRYSTTLRRSIVFGNIRKWPANVDYDDPSTCGVYGGRNLSIEFFSQVDYCQIKIGLWHILPKSSYEKLKNMFNENSDKEILDKMMTQELINSNKPIMLYCHGYGDSTNVVASESGVVEDSLVVYDWLQTTLGEGHNKPGVFVWGHSLGTGISSHFLGNLKELSEWLLEKETLPPPNGLILECPFSNMADEFRYHQSHILLSWMPYWHWSFVAPFEECPHHSFRSDRHLARVPGLPILILHAKDDFIVPYVVGKKLYDHLKNSRSSTDAEVMLHAFDCKLGLGHKFICTADDLGDIVGYKLRRVPSAKQPV